MYLKSIEIQGFKSFANRLVFEFNKGITGIVGPNGSGKSNITDAVRWVLGEQSAKQLRGAKMEDVIFAGTETRKPLGFAYVAITLDNSDHRLPISYDTVTVSRRVFRSGESEFRINGHSCRLKDIHELFFDTGIGKEGYSIIGQNQIEKILSEKPEGRRELLDEAAGIVKYKRRRESAAKDLDQEEINISRVEDILAELERQVGPLKEQSEKAKRYLGLRDDLKVYEANVYLDSFENLKKDGADLAGKLGIVQDQIDAQKDEFEQIRRKTGEIESLMDSYDKTVTSLTEKRTADNVELQRLQGDKDIVSTKRENIRSALETSADRTREIRGKIEAKEAEIAEQEKELGGLNEEYDKAKALESRSEAELEKLQERIASLEKENDSLNDESIDLLNRIAQERSRLERYNAMQEQNEKRDSELNQQRDSLQKETQNESSLVDAFLREKDEIEEQLRGNAEEKQLQEEAQKRLDEQLREARELLARHQKSYHEQNARYRTLKNITERYEGYGGSIRRVMEKKSEEPGLIGVVADIIRTGKKYETAIETALGGSISNIVTEDEATARRMIEFLKENRYGRATFLPLTSITPRGGSVDAGVRREPGFIGMADELIETGDRYRSIAAFLLGRIFIVDNMDHAFAIARKYRYRLRIVTLDGESLSPGGSISGGAYRRSGNLLARHREMDEALQSVRRLSVEIEKTADQIEEFEKERKAAQETLEKIAGTAQELNIRKNTVQVRMNEVAKSHSEHDKNLSDIKAQLRQLGSNKDEIEKLSSSIRARVEEYEKKQEKAQERMQKIASQMDELRAGEEEKSSRNTELIVQHSQLKQRLEFVSTNLQRCRSEKEGLEKDLENILCGNEETSRQMAGLDEKEKQLVSRIEECRERIDKENSELEKAQTERSRYNEEHKNFFERREKLSDSLSALDREQVRLSAQKDKIEEKRQELSDHMWEEYELTYVSAKEFLSEKLQEESPSKLRRHIADTKNAIRSLGDININAIEQYKEVAERYETMKTQHDDLVDARNKLNGIICSLNSSMKKQFSEKFAQINEEFDKTFTALFGGGKASLSLTDPDDILGSGINITAQPPGKKLVNMLQMSGGEKALTAIALLFAIQNLRPSPFCLLDETEAALDDANVERYADYLHKLTNDTQFIVITHRRGTMKAADVLYGITMQEKGVSTMVSVSLIENQLSK